MMTLAFTGFDPQAPLRSAATATGLTAPAGAGVDGGLPGCTALARRDNDRAGYHPTVSSAASAFWTNGTTKTAVRPPASSESRHHPTIDLERQAGASRSSRATRDRAGPQGHHPPGCDRGRRRRAHGHLLRPASPRIPACQLLPLLSVTCTGDKTASPTATSNPNNDPHTDPDADGDPDDQPDACIAGRYADTIRIATPPATASTASSATIGDMHRWDDHRRGWWSVVPRRDGGEYFVHNNNWNDNAGAAPSSRPATTTTGSWSRTRRTTPTCRCRPTRTCTVTTTTYRCRPSRRRGSRPPGRIAPGAFGTSPSTSGSVTDSHTS